MINDKNSGYVGGVALLLFGCVGLAITGDSTEMTAFSLLLFFCGAIMLSVWYSARRGPA